MPSKRDTEEERMSRIAALMEEYRVNHEDLVAYVKTINSQTQTARHASRKGVEAAREAFKRNKRT